MNVYALRMSLAEKALSIENELDFYLPKHFVLRRYATGMKRVLVPLLPRDLKQPVQRTAEWMPLF